MTLISSQLRRCLITFDIILEIFPKVVRSRLRRSAPLSSALAIGVILTLPNIKFRLIILDCDYRTRVDDIRKR